MIVRNIVKKNSYYDSATLMLLTSKVGEKLESAQNIAVMMGSDMNKSLMESSGLLTGEGRGAGANDLIFAIRAATEAEVDAAMAEADNALNSKARSAEKTDSEVVKTVDAALEQYPDAALAVVSLPGQYAAREVKKLLLADRHVLLFSDNVTIEQENELKDLAVERGLLMMGPDCGTAMINGVGLGFSNKVKRGPIGMVAASGTGLQEVMRLISNGGGGISQAFGTGGRDVKESIGGKMMLSCLAVLEEDSATKIVVIVSKPPAPAVMQKIAAYIKKMSKPVVACFLGGDPEVLKAAGCRPAATLEEAARLALELNAASNGPAGAAGDVDLSALAAGLRAGLKPDQMYIRGLFCGGTLAYESMLLLREKAGKVYSNIALTTEEALEDNSRSQEHTILDLGDDEFTRGKPHPMIEPALRGERLVAEALDPETAVILVDVELGYGSHKDPASVLAGEVTQARAQLAEAGRQVAFVATICGTYEDFQGYQGQKAILEEQGVVVLESNAMATRLAMEVAGIGGKA